jgi:hypothetical protein
MPVVAVHCWKKQLHHADAITSHNARLAISHNVTVHGALLGCWEHKQEGGGGHSLLPCLLPVSGKLL